MKMKKRIRSIKIHLWASLTINICVYFISSHRVSTTPTYIIGLLLVFSLFFIRGLVKTSYDMQVDDTSIISLIFDYACAIGASSLLGYEIYYYDDIFFITYILAILFEILVLLLIIYWNKIIRVFKNTKNSKK